MAEPADNAGLPISGQARLGIDTGGTFTDFALLKAGRLYTHKVLSTPEAPEQAILQGIEEMGLTDACRSGLVQIIHGSTVATNAALQNRGVKTLFLTNQGLEDILSIGRQNRADIYHLKPTQNPPPVPSSRCLGIPCRIDSQGRELERLSSESLAELISQVSEQEPEALAVCLLFSYLDAKQEQQIKEAFEDRFFVSISSEVLSESGEYERGIATWLNASLGPLMQSYLNRLGNQVSEDNLSVMQSSGGTISCKQAARKAVQLLLSGPAGGLSAAQHIKQKLKSDGLLTFDMGGTSSDVALIKQDIRLTREGKIGPYPVAVPMVDMHTIGAGGGSIAYLDEAGMLHLGPESAGAKPGPAGYGLGGTRATVTDAHILLGNLQSQSFAAGNLKLDHQAALDAIRELADQVSLSEIQMAGEILELANEHMAQALRQISVQRGEDPAHFSLCSFGGAGGLHVCALAEKLGMHKAVIPANAGILSALGMLLAPGNRELSKTVRSMDQHALQHMQRECELLAAQGRKELQLEGYPAEKISSRYSLDCRYLGQSFTLNIPFSKNANRNELVEAFHSAHEQNFGYRLGREVELVTLRAHIEARHQPIELPELENTEEALPTRVTIYQRVKGNYEKRSVDQFDRNQLASGQVINGPALICEEASTSWIAEGWSARADKSGHLLLSLASD